MDIEVLLTSNGNLFVMPKQKGRIYITCPVHTDDSSYLQYGEKTCIKRLYFKPNNKLKSIENLWICEKTGNVFMSDGSRKQSYYGSDKRVEGNLKTLDQVPGWNELFPELTGG